MRWRTIFTALRCCDITISCGVCQCVFMHDRSMQEQWLLSLESKARTACSAARAKKRSLPRGANSARGVCCVLTSQAVTKAFCRKGKPVQVGSGCKMVGNEIGCISIFSLFPFGFHPQNESGCKMDENEIRYLRYPFVVSSNFHPRMQRLSVVFRFEALVLSET